MGLRILLAVAVVLLGALFGAGPVRAGGAQALFVEDWWRVSPGSSMQIVFGACGLVPVLSTVAVLLAAGRYRRLGQEDDAKEYEGWAKVFLGVLLVVQLVLIPYHELRLTGAHQSTLGTGATLPEVRGMLCMGGVAVPLAVLISTLFEGWRKKRRAAG